VLFESYETKIKKVLLAGWPREAQAAIGLFATIPAMLLTNSGGGFPLLSLPEGI
jgi:hypothetical protein